MSNQHSKAHHDFKSCLYAVSWLLRPYNNYFIGTFVLYKSLNRVFEDMFVNVLTAPIPSPSPVTVIAAWEDNDIAVLDMCNGQFLETQP